jgi:ribonuclease HII
MSFHLVGIDEAGYGPQLGPLVVSAVVLELPDAMLARQRSLPKIACLWKTLSNIISENKSCVKVTVCDSKALYQPARGIKELERTALVFKRLIEPDYCNHNELTLPLSADNNEINRLTQTLRVELNTNSIQFREVKASIVEPTDFNGGIRRLRNKADFLWEVSGELIKHCVDKYNHKNMVVIRAGKQGGRNYYLPYLQRLFAGKIVRPVEQGFDNSSYIIRTKPSVNALISFIKDGDASEFAIALASIFSKYYRELSMLKLNRFFQSHIPLLKPTSGYHPDSRRFIRAINPLFNKLGLERNNFIRMR